MSKRKRRILVAGLASLALLAGLPSLLWMSVTHQPTFYKAMVSVDHQQSQEQAKLFLAQSLQLSNDIRNEPRWEAAFTDREVNAWLAEDLVAHFADLLPPEVHEPRVVFEPDRVTLAFQLDQGPVRAVIWVVARVAVPEQNVVELTVEKIRAGVVPVPAAKIIERLTAEACARGFDVRWRQDGELPVALIRYTPDLVRSDVVLEQLQVRRGQIRLAGRSNAVKGAIVSPVLPRRKVLQSAFPRRQRQATGGPPPSVPTLRNSISPTS